MIFLRTFTLLLFVASCTKYEPVFYSNLPKNVGKGGSVLFMNGLSKNYSFSIERSKNKKWLEFNIRSSEDGVDNLIRAIVPAKDTILSKPNLDFSRELNENGFEAYDLRLTEDNFFEIELDTINMVSSGRLQGYFIRINPSGSPASKRLPRELLFQCVFHENYIQE